MVSILRECKLHTTIQKRQSGSPNFQSDIVANFKFRMAPNFQKKQLVWACLRGGKKSMRSFGWTWQPYTLQIIVQVDEDWTFRCIDGYSKCKDIYFGTWLREMLICTRYHNIHVSYPPVFVSTFWAAIPLWHLRTRIEKRKTKRRPQKLRSNCRSSHPPNPPAKRDGIN